MGCGVWSGMFGGLIERVGGRDPWSGQRNGRLEGRKKRKSVGEIQP